MSNNETCLSYVPKNDSERNLLIAVYEKLNSVAWNTLYEPIIFWLVDTKCVWVVSQNTFFHRMILKEYPNQKEATFTQVKEVALSLILGIDEYY